MTASEAKRRNLLYRQARLRWRERYPLAAVSAPRELTAEELRRRAGGDG